MSSITATRASRFTAPGAPTRVPTPKPSRGRRTAGPSGQGALVGRTDRPVLRIVASRPAPPLDRAVPETAGSESAQAGFETPLRPVDLADFFVPDYDGDDVAVEMRRPRPSSVRLTRRGRLVVVGAGLAASLGLGFVAATGSLASDKPEPTRVVTVRPGQTLWSIASGLAAGGDVRVTMSRLEAVNHLDSTTLQVGQRLRVPR